jgi:SNF2 family DNA or RNA helicase
MNEGTKNTNSMPIRAAPFAHQSAAYAAALETFASGNSQGYALLMEMGCGKSLTAIGITGALYLGGKIRRVLVVAPLSIVGVWQEEFAKFAAFDYTLAILDGTLVKKADTLRHLAGESLQVAVVNYESAWRLEKEILAWLKGSGEAFHGLVIADEGHKLKSHTTNASKALHRIGAAAQYRLLLTGTLITNKPLDVFSQYKFLNPSIFGNSFYSWRNRYFDMTGYGKHTPILKRSMEAGLTAKMHSIAYRATKAECLDLPATTDIVRHIDLEPNAAKLYRDLVKDSYAQLASGEVTATNVLTRLLRLSQLTGGFLGGDDEPKPHSVSTAKLDALADIIESARESGQKFVIIARFVAEIAAIKRLLEKQGIQYAAISGETKDRAEQVKMFQENSDVTVFVGQIATAGLGITLTAASTLVFYSLDYNMANFEQAKARIHRVGQVAPCTYIYLTAKGTVDEKVLKALREKADLAKTLIDDCRNGRNPFN